MWHSFSEKACSGFPAVSFYKLTIRTQPIWKLRAAYFTVGLTASQRHPNVIDGNTKLKSLLRGAPAVLHLFAWSRFSNVAGLPHTILWERKHLVSNDYSTKVGSLLSPSLVKFQCLYPLLGFVWILWIFLMNLFLTLLYKKKNTKLLPVETRKRLLLISSGWHTLSANGSFSHRRKSFPSNKPLRLPTVSAKLKITILTYHSGGALAVGLTRIEHGDSALTLANHPTFPACFLGVIIQNTQGREAHLTGMAYVTNYGQP